MFSDAVDETRSTPSMPKVASSTRRVMPSSTSDGVAPGYGTVMEMMPRVEGGEDLGGQPEGRDESADQHHGHHQVGGDRVVGEGGDDAPVLAGLRRAP